MHKAVNQRLNGVHGIREVEADVREVKRRAAKAIGVHDAAHDGHEERRNLLGEQITREQAEQRDRQNRKTHDRVAEHVEHALRRHPDEADAGPGSPMA